MNKLGFFAFILALPILAACNSTGNTPKQFTVRIMDAEIRAPISGAQIDLHYFPYTPDSPEPGHPRAVADSQGVVTLSNKNESAIWQVRADGYIEQRLSSQPGTLPPQYTAHASSNYDGIIYLYQLPEPELNILVNDNYTGPLTIRLEPAPGFDWVPVDEINVAFAAVDPQASYIQEPAGTRIFTAKASDNGVVDLVVAPLLYDIKPHQLHVYDSNGVLPFHDISNSQDSDRGVWGTVTEDQMRLEHLIRLFVGTLEDYLNNRESGQ